MKIKATLLIYIFTMMACLAQKPSKAESYFEQANTEIDKGAYDKAIPHFLKAIKSDPTGSCGTKIKGKAHNDLGHAYFRSGDSTNAMVYYNKAISLNKTNPYPRLNKAALYLMQKKHNQALKELDALIALSPDFVNAYVERGFLHHSENNYPASAIDLTKALSLDSTQQVLAPTMKHSIEKRLSEMKRGE